MLLIINQGSKVQKQLLGYLSTEGGMLGKLATGCFVPTAFAMLNLLTQRMEGCQDKLCCMEPRSISKRCALTNL